MIFDVTRARIQFSLSPPKVSNQAEVSGRVLPKWYVTAPGLSVRTTLAGKPVVAWGGPWPAHPLRWTILLQRGLAKCTHVEDPDRTPRWYLRPPKANPTYNLRRLANLLGKSNMRRVDEHTFLNHTSKLASNTGMKGTAFCPNLCEIARKYAISSCCEQLLRCQWILREERLNEGQRIIQRRKFLQQRRLVSDPKGIGCTPKRCTDQSPVRYSQTSSAEPKPNPPTREIFACWRIAR